MRLIRLIRVTLLGLVLALPDGAGAQSTAGPAPAAGVSAPAQETVSGLPRQAPPPRTLRAHWHVFVAFALAWLLLFGYVIVLGRRFGQLDRDLERMMRPPA